MCVCNKCLTAACRRRAAKQSKAPEGLDLDHGTLRRARIITSSSGRPTAKGPDLAAASSREAESLQNHSTIARQSAVTAVRAKGDAARVGVTQHVRARDDGLAVSATNFPAPDGKPPSVIAAASRAVEEDAPSELMRELQRIKRQNEELKKITNAQRRELEQRGEALASARPGPDKKPQVDLPEPAAAAYLDRLTEHRRLLLQVLGLTSQRFTMLLLVNIRPHWPTIEYMPC